MSHADGGGHHLDCSLGLLSLMAECTSFTTGRVSSELGVGDCFPEPCLCSDGSCCFFSTGGFCNSAAPRIKHVKSMKVHPLSWPGAPSFPTRSGKMGSSVLPMS